jgi:hypothetical protein
MPNPKEAKIVKGKDGKLLHYQFCAKIGLRKKI